MIKRITPLLVVGMVAWLLPLMGIATAHDGPALTPESVEQVVLAGTEFDVEKTVHTAAIPPLVDICLVEDETGSFGDDIANLQALAPNLVAALDASGSDYATCVVGFRDFAQSIWGDSGDWVYRLLADVGAGGAPLLAGVGMLTAGGGFDGPEAQLEALHYLADPGHAPIDSNGDADTVDANDTPAGLQPTWRLGAKRVVLLATDAGCHVTGDAGGWPGDAGTADPLATAGALAGAGITLIGLTPGGAGLGCVDVLAANAAPGGSVQSTTSAGDDIVEAILAGLGNLPVDVSMATNCAGPVFAEFDPAAQMVTSGDDAIFTETISVAADAAPGVYECDDWALIDGEPMTDADGNVILEHKTITVAAPFCEEGVNPAGKTPQAPGQGQNEDGFYLIGAEPADAGLSVFVHDDGSGTVFGPFPSGTNIKYTEANGADPSIKAGSGEVDWKIKGQGDASVSFVDDFGNIAFAACLVPPPPK